MMLQRFPDKSILSAPAILNSLEPGVWLAQYKQDGWRMVIEVTVRGFTFTSRHNEPLPVSLSLRAIVESQVAGLPIGTIIDGEYMGLRDKQSERIWLFDILRIGDEWQSRMPALSRFNMLKQLAPPEWIVGHTLDDYADFFESSKVVPGCEGIVLKRIDSGLRLSVRACADNPAHLKVKWRSGADGQVRVA
jgi:ATP-dependent DNA ligase